MRESKGRCESPQWNTIQVAAGSDYCVSVERRADDRIQSWEHGSGSLISGILIAANPAWRQLWKPCFLFHRQRKGIRLRNGTFEGRRHVGEFSGGIPLKVAIALAMRDRLGSIHRKCHEPWTML